MGLVEKDCRARQFMELAKLGGAAGREGFKKLHARGYNNGCPPKHGDVTIKPAAKIGLVMVRHHDVLRVLAWEAYSFPQDTNRLVDNICIRSDDEQAAEVVFQGRLQEEGGDRRRLTQTHGGFAASEGVRNVSVPCRPVESCAGPISGAAAFSSEVLDISIQSTQPILPTGRDRPSRNNAAVERSRIGVVGVDQTRQGEPH